ncbi:tail fiber protein [Escherichia coli]|nr:tail fiber protein [Escherichia coli]
MMMIYGMFVFELRTLPHQQLQQNKSWRHVKNERVNRSASWQYIGAGDDRIVLSGVLYPEITGGESVAFVADHAGIYRTPLASD